MTRRRRNTLDPASNPLVLLAGALTLMLALAVLVIAARSSGGLPGESHYDLRVQFAQRVGAPLPPRGSDVRIAGRRVGQTRDARLERGVATLYLQLDPDVGPLPEDTRAAVRAQGLLGAKYVDLVPGRSRRTLPDESLIRRADIAVTLSDVLQAFKPPARTGLRQAFRGLGGGLAGRGERLNEGLDDLALGFKRFSLSLRPVLADRSLPRLVGGAESLAGALDPVHDDVGRLMPEGERALRPFAAEQPSVQKLLAVAPGALEGIRSGLAQTDPVLTRAERFAAAAATFTTDASPALDGLTRLLRAGRRPLHTASYVLTTARAAVAPTLRLTDAARPVLPRLAGLLDHARQPTRVLGRYGCDIARFGETWRSMIGYAARGQSGALGPMTILRTTLVGSGGVPAAPNANPAAKLDGTIAPCEGLR